MSNVYFRKSLTDAATEEEFKEVFRKQSESFIQEARQSLSEDFRESEEDTFEDMGVWVIFTIEDEIFFNFYLSCRNSLSGILAGVLFKIWSVVYPSIGLIMSMVSWNIFVQSFS